MLRGRAAWRARRRSTRICATASPTRCRRSASRPAGRADGPRQPGRHRCAGRHRRGWPRRRPDVAALARSAYLPSPPEHGRLSHRRQHRRRTNGGGRAFYGELLGMRVAMDLGFIVTFASDAPTTPQLSVASRGRSGHAGARPVDRGRRRRRRLSPRARRGVRGDLWPHREPRGACGASSSAIRSAGWSISCRTRRRFFTLRLVIDV